MSRESDVTKNGSDVRVGQVWKDWDTRYRRREPGRLLKVEKVDSRYAYLRGIAGGRRARVMLKRMRPTSTGYKLIEDVREVTRRATGCEICGGPTLESHCGCLDLIGEFSNAMIGELVANAHKGGRRGPMGWKAQDYRVLVGEVLYHAAKLSYAARQFSQGDGDSARVLEFAADTANMALMVADSLGAMS